MAENTPLLLASSSSSSSPSPSSSSSKSTLRALIRAYCTWISKRTAITYDDFLVSSVERNALDQLRHELLDHDITGTQLAQWKEHDSLRSSAPVDNDEYRVEMLLRQLWSALFPVDTATSSSSPSSSSSASLLLHQAWRVGCICSSSPSLQGTCPATARTPDEHAIFTTFPTIPSSAWIGFGFQQPDPRSDLRALGTAGLRYLHRLLTDQRYTAYRTDALALAIGCMRGTALPLAIAAFNVQYMLACHLHLFAFPPAFCPCCGSRIRTTEYSNRSSQSHRGASLRGFIALLTDDPDAFYHLYAIGLLLVAKEWSTVSIYPPRATRSSSPTNHGTKSGIAAAVAALNDTAHGKSNPPRTRCLDLANCGIRTGDERLLQFPDMLARVQQRIMQSLAGAAPSFPSSPHSSTVSSSSSVEHGTFYQPPVNGTSSNDTVDILKFSSSASSSSSVSLSSPHPPPSSPPKSVTKARRYSGFGSPLSFSSKPRLSIESIREQLLGYDYGRMSM